MADDSDPDRAPTSAVHPEGDGVEHRRRGPVTDRPPGDPDARVETDGGADPLGVERSLLSLAIAVLVLVLAADRVAGSLLGAGVFAAENAAFLEPVAERLRQIAGLTRRFALAVYAVFAVLLGAVCLKIGIRLSV